MPGIVGLITRMPRERAVCELSRMIGSLSHEPFYTSGTLIEESLGVYAGWTAQVNCVPEGMPVRNASGDVMMVFSGEDFSSAGAVGQCGNEPNGRGTHGLSHVVRQYEEDPSFPVGLNGRFHGIVVDRTRGIVLLFNDRYGMRRVYYHEGSDALYFAAEAKAILAVRPELREIDAAGLVDRIACGSVLEDRTLFRDIYALPIASAWVCRNGSVVRKERYFDPVEWENQGELDSATYYKTLREVVSEIIPRYFSGHQRLGMSLTGGLDSRMIMAWRKPEPGSLPCYTFGGPLRECQDVIVGRRVAHACAQSHEVISLDKTFLSRFAHYAERAVYLSDGCVGVAHAADAYLSEKEREIAEVRMTGNYGGEVLRRVQAFKPMRALGGLFQAELTDQMARCETIFAQLTQKHPVSFAVFNQAPWYHYGVLALEETQLSVRSPYLDNDFVRTVFRAPEATLSTSDCCIRLIADGNPALINIPTDRGLCGDRGRHFGALSHAFSELMFKAEYAYDLGMPHSMARLDHRFSRMRLERVFLGRHKTQHFRIWYRDALAEYVKEILLDDRSLSRSYVNRLKVESVVGEHLKGTANYTSEIHTLLSLELFHRLFIDYPGPGYKTLGGLSVPADARG